MLLLVVAPALSLFGTLGDELAAESIARHALRAAVLSSSSHDQLSNEIARQIAPLANSWGKELKSYGLSCSSPCLKGALVDLEVRIGNSSAIQTAALDPKR